MELKDIAVKFDELGRAHDEFKKAHTAELADAKKSITAAADRIEKTEKINDAVSNLQDEIKKMQAAMTRSNGGGNADQVQDEKKAAFKKAFNGYLRKGGNYEHELKGLNVENNEDGGFLVNPEMSTEIVTKVFESSPMRELCSVQTISSDQLEILEDLEEMASGWVGEQQSRPETDVAKFKKIMIPVHELYAQPKASQKMLDDAAINIESWIAEKVAAKFSRDEATSFVSGNGVMKPKGILSYGAGDGFGLIEQVNSGHASQITADGLIELVYAIKPQYAGNAKFLMQRATEKAVRKLKDLQNRYLWEMALTAGAPSTILGHAIYQANDMQAISASNLAMAFGDFKAGYQIVDRVGIRILRDVYTAKPHVLFYTTKRVGGAVKNFEAIKLMKISA